jgi:SP family general alpha glucoside:H+ symporter-like MFS transporter
MAQEMAFNYSMAIQSINIFATGTAVYLMGRLNRRTFYLFGTSTICVAQVIIGILGVVGGTKVAAGIAGMMIVINLAFKLSLGPACYTMISEMPNSRLRAYTIVLARGSYILVSVVTNQIIPRQLGAWGWGGKAGFFWFGTCFLSLLYTFFRIPETRNRSFLELDYLFHERVKARAFRTYPVNSMSYRSLDCMNKH